MEGRKEGRKKERKERKMEREIEREKGRKKEEKSPLLTLHLLKDNFFFHFFPGALIMPSLVLSYIQLGQFLMLIMSVSWVYSTFFFQALCSIFGPENDTGQLTFLKVKAAYEQLKKCCCCTNDKSDCYQVLKKKDGTIIKRQAKVIYIK